MRAGVSRHLLLFWILTLTILLAGAPISVVAAATRPQAAQAGVELPTPFVRNGIAALIRDLPVGLPEKQVWDAPSDMRPVAIDAFGPLGAQTLLRALSDERLMGDQYGKYPYRFRAIDRLLDSAPEQGRTRATAELGAALVVLASRTSQSGVGSDQIPSNAARIAVSLLQRARAAAPCDANVNLLLLLSSDLEFISDAPERQAAIAIGACPQDPTPAWILGMYQSRKAAPDLHDGYELGTGPDLAMIEKARNTADVLVSRFPSSPDVWAAFGDVHYQAGADLRPSRPFSGRMMFQLAEAAYQRAQLLGGGHELRGGVARALMGLDQPAQAIELLTADLEAFQHQGPALNLLIEAQEQARDFESVAENARRALDSGPAAYPQSGSLFPGQIPVSIGFDSAVPLSVRLIPPGGNGAEVVDLAFIPSFRPQGGVTGASADCPELAWRRALMLTGRADLAADGISDDFENVRRWPRRTCDDRQGEIAEVIVGEALGIEEVDEARRNAIDDARQNLWRWAGNVTRAREVIDEWDRRTGHQLVLPPLRTGELDYLDGRFADASIVFGRAERRGEDGRYRITLETGRARLAKASAMVADGRAASGLEEFRLLDRDASYAAQELKDDYSNASLEYSLISYYSRLLSGDAHRIDGEPHAAEEDYLAAEERLPLTSLGDAIVPGVLYNNLALAELDAGKSSQALVHSEKAVDVDEANTAFLLTAAASAELAGHRERAVELNATALRHDPAAFPAANNLAVLVAGDGDRSQAVKALRQAVGARPDYALGWFNLGVIYSTSSLLYVPFAQGSLGKARQLDPKLQDSPRELTLDRHVYRTGLDLSKPLPARWSLADVERRQPVAALGLVGTLTLALGLVRLGTGNANSQLQTMIQAGSSTLRRAGWLARRRHYGWAVGATVTAFVLPFWWRDDAGIANTVVYLGGIVLLTLSLMSLRQLLTRRRGSPPVQRSWPPAIVAGVVSAFLSFPLAPLPYVRASRRDRFIHAAGPMMLGLVAVLLLLESLMLGTPMARAIGSAAIAMAASLLIPIQPLDGGYLGKAGAAAGVMVIGIGVLVVLGLL